MKENENTVLPTTTAPQVEMLKNGGHQNNHHHTTTTTTTTASQPVTTTTAQTTTTTTTTTTTAIEKKGEHSIYIVCMNTYATIIVFIYHLISYECMFSIITSVSCTIYIYYQILIKQQQEKDATSTTTSSSSSSFNGNAMNWILLSFAIIIPIGSIITMVYTRRESALQQMTVLKTTLLQLYTSYAIWNWDYQRSSSSSSCDGGGEMMIATNGRIQSSMNWLQFTDDAMKEIFHLCQDVTCLLSLPTDTRARHKITKNGKMDAKTIHTIHLQYVLSITKRFGTLATICEVLKREGLPPNESNRIRQWERICFDAIERLRMIKMYRTPQGLRSFGRLFTMFLPPFYAPYYAQLAYEINSLGMGIAFAILTALALTSLFETISQMEDPFDVSSVLDGVNVHNDLIHEFQPQFLALRDQYFPNSPPFCG